MAHLKYKRAGEADLCLKPTLSLDIMIMMMLDVV